MKKTNALLWFIFGAITFRWFIDVGDILVQMFINTQNKKATQIQLDINNIVSQANIEGEEISTNVIGFNTSFDDDEYYDEEEYDDE